jgi:hypothetical protein
VWIFFGEYDWEKELGVVGDECSVCGELATLKVSQFYRKFHLYFIPLTSGRLLSTILTCSRCGSRVDGNINAYEQPVPEREARDLGVEWVLKRTNPRLAYSLRRQAKLEREVKEGRVREGAGPDPRVELAFARLAELGTAHPRAPELLARLAQWSILDADEQAMLLFEVETLFSDKKRVQDAAYFVQRIALRFNPRVDAGLGCLTAAVIFFGAIALAYFLAPLALLSVMASCVAAPVLGVRVHRAYRRSVHKKFFRTIFIPEAAQQGIEMADVVATLQRINPLDKRLDKQLRGLAANIELLNEVLLEDSLEAFRTHSEVGASPSVASP